MDAKSSIPGELYTKANLIGLKIIHRRTGAYALVDRSKNGVEGDVETITAIIDRLQGLEGKPPVICKNKQGLSLWSYDPETKTITHHNSKDEEEHDRKECVALYQKVEDALSDLAANIKAEHEQAKQALRDGVMHAVRAGELLRQAKAEMPHGEWEDWLKANVQFSSRTARAYMQLAKLDPEKRQRVADLPLREALSAISSRERKLTEAAERENRPPPGPAIAVDQTDWEKYQNSPPRQPLSLDERADELVQQLVQCAHEADVSEEVLIAALRRRFSALTH